MSEQSNQAQMHLSREKLEAIRGMLDQADHYIRSARHLLMQEAVRERVQEIEGSSSCQPSDEGKVVEGVFDGERMLGTDQHQYPVPPNYASKSKLVAGDVLKLIITEDGSFVYKQIGPVERRKLVGVLEEVHGDFYVRAEDKTFQVLRASITYYRAKPGDQLTIVVPRDTETDWAAVENILEKVGA